MRSNCRYGYDALGRVTFEGCVFEDQRVHNDAAGRRNWIGYEDGRSRIVSRIGHRLPTNIDPVLGGL